MSASPYRVVIAGGGIAATELLIALRELAEERVAIQLLAPKRELVYRPLAVAEPFGVGRALRFDLDAIAADHGAKRRGGVLAAVDPEARIAYTTAGAELEFDALIVAVGARAEPALPGALSLSGPDGFDSYRELLAALGTRGPERLALVVPPGASWPLPLYELALMTAVWLTGQDRHTVDISIITPEEQPLGIFGARASAAVSELLEERGIELVTSACAEALDDDCVVLQAERRHPADRVVALPTLSGPHIRGLPHDQDGFIPVDGHGSVEGTDCVWAAGDATTFPVKQGGLATQQADAVAEAVAAAAGAPLTPEPFDPVLRGLLLTGSLPAFLRTELGPDGGTSSEVDFEPLWWPPGKVVGLHLSHYLARLAAAAPPAEAFGLQIETDDLEEHLHRR